MIFSILIPQADGDCQRRNVSSPSHALFYRTVAGTEYDGPIDEVDPRSSCECTAPVIDYVLPLSRDRLIRDLLVSRTHLKST